MEVLHIVYVAEVANILQVGKLVAVVVAIAAAAAVHGSFVLLVPIIPLTVSVSCFPLKNIWEDLSFFTHLDRVDLSDNQLGRGLR